MSRLFEEIDRETFERVVESFDGIISWVITLGGKVVIDNEGEHPYVEINYLGRKVRMSPTKGVDPGDFALHQRFTSSFDTDEPGYGGLCSIAALRNWLFHESQLRG